MERIGLGRRPHGYWWNIVLNQAPTADDGADQEFVTQGDTVHAEVARPPRPSGLGLGRYLLTPHPWTQSGIFDGDPVGLRRGGP